MRLPKPVPVPYCEACEGQLSVHASVHVEPANMCVAYGRCPRAGICLTCEMLDEWMSRAEGNLTS